MTAIFNALPGWEAPVGSISKSLASMWADTAADGRPAPDSEEAKATQVNFVLHLGFNTTADDAAAQFQTVVRFSRKYPSRVVVLCPMGDDSAESEMRAKVYGECTVGKSKGDTRCCEFVMLSYPHRARQYLESEVSICLSTDLPLYYWAHRFSAASRLGEYRYLLTRSKRVLVDSAIEPAETMAYPWPRPAAVRDLAYARLLPVRQALGQFLSRYPMESICRGLQTVTVTHGSALAAEARVLLEWNRERVSQCGENRASFAVAAPPQLAASALGVTFAYAEGKAFTWQGDVAAGSALFQANFGLGRTTLPATVSLLAPENALAEAMFF